MLTRPPCQREVVRMLRDGRVKEFNELRQHFPSWKVRLKNVRLWFIEHSLHQLDLGKAGLAGISFNSSTLWWANFSGADLREAEFTFAEVVQAHFNGAKLVGANFHQAKASGAVFCEADLSGADFSGADLSYTNFEGATLTGVKFYGAHLWGARGLPAEVRTHYLDELAQSWSVWDKK